MVKVKKAGANIDSLRREATCLAMLQHPHIVSYYASYTFKKGKVFAIVTELLSGGSLLERMRAGASREELNRCVGELASALAHMHGLRVQHRDVKPENVLLDGTGSAKLIDVGLACILGSRSRVSTKAGGLGLVGTTLYMSPEKGSGKRQELRRKGRCAWPRLELRGRQKLCLWRACTCRRRAIASPRLAVIHRSPFETHIGTGVGARLDPGGRCHGQATRGLRAQHDWDLRPQPRRRGSACRGCEGGGA